LAPASSKPRGLRERIVAVAIRHRTAAAVLLVVLGTAFSAGVRDLWFGDEARYGGVLDHLLQGGHGVVLYLAGAPYPDKPPLYFWLVAGTARLLHTEGLLPFLVISALSGLALVLCTMRYTERVLRAAPEASLLSGLLLLSNFVILFLLHYARMDLLFAALIVAAHVVLHPAWDKRRAWGACLAGFALVAAATLTKGPLALAFVLLPVIVELGLRRRLRRLLALDVAAGALLLASFLMLWGIGVVHAEGAEYMGT